MTYPRRSSFTERLHDVLELAHRVASGLGHSAVSPVHLALGLLREGQGVAVTALRYHGVDLAIFKRVLEAAVVANPRAPEPRATLAMTAAGEEVLAQARREAAALNHRYVGTEHLLLALMADPGSPTAEAFAERGLTPSLARARILWILGADPQNPAPFVAPAV